MKSSSKSGLLSVSVFLLFTLFIVLVVSCTGNPQTSYSLTLLSKVDTSGNQTPPHYTISTALPAGTMVTLVCTKNCIDSSGNPTSPKILFQGALTQDIPANTELSFEMVSK